MRWFLKNANALAIVLALLATPAFAQPLTTFQSERTQATTPIVAGSCIAVYQPTGASPPFKLFKLCGSFATAFGYTTKPQYNTNYDREQGNPGAATGTTSTSCKMMGLSAGTGNQPTILAPNGAGNYLIMLNAWATNSTTLDGWSAQVYEGTGTPPANGAAATGTPIGTVQTANVGAGTKRNPLLFVTYETGLAAGTWIDVCLAATTAGTASITASKPIAIER